MMKKGFFREKDRHIKEDMSINDSNKMLDALILGPTGCGKTYPTFKLMVLAELSSSSKTVIILDPVGIEAFDINAELLSMNENYDYIDVHDCVNSFNPLCGNTEDVVDELSSVVKAYCQRYDYNNYLKSNMELINHSIRIIKSVKGKDATFNDLNFLLNLSKEGLSILNEFKFSCKESNRDSLDWFLDYCKSEKKQRDALVLKNIITRFLERQSLSLLTIPVNSIFSVNLEEFINSGKTIIINGSVNVLGEDGWLVNHLVLQKINTILSKRNNKERAISFYIKDYSFLSNERTYSLFLKSKELNISVTIDF